MRSWHYLLDTNILSNLIRYPRGKIAQIIRQRGQDLICTNIIVASELRFGAQQKNSPLLLQRINELLDNIAVLSLSPETGIDHHYAQIRIYLEQQGTPIGPNDLLIAAHARSQNLILVTDNSKEFSRVPELTIENWLIP
ncbi:hypothetical protein TI05_10625 [Achromatium sp. WMS3]|nr:hypothetical protein TI05_10625 [Achromatium sp. WMS3]